MQWASVIDSHQEIINHSFAPVNHYGNQYHDEMPFRIVADKYTESIHVYSYTDLSGELLSEIERVRNTKFDPAGPTQSSTQGVPTLHEITNAFKGLKTQHTEIRKDQAALEESIRSICTYQKQVNDTLQLLINAIASTTALSVDEFTAFQTSTNNFREILQQTIKKPHESLTRELMTKSNLLLSVSQNLTVYQSFLKVAATELFGTDIKPNTCAICYENSVSVALIPCGHTFCSKCLEKTDTTTITQHHTCMTCRTPYTNKMKIYL